MPKNFEKIGNSNRERKEENKSAKDKFSEGKISKAEKKENNLQEIESKAIDIFFNFEEKIIKIEKTSPIKEIDKARDKIGFERKIDNIKNKINFAVNFAKIKIGSSKSENDPFDFSLPKKLVKEIREYPKEKRKEAVDKVKAAIYEQNKKIAEIEKKFISEIRRNPDISDGEIKRMVRETAKENNFSWQQYSVIDEAADNFISNRRNIKKLKERYKSPNKLYKYIFQVTPHENVEIINHPFALVFLLGDFDYSAAIQKVKMNVGSTDEAKEIFTEDDDYSEGCFLARELTDVDCEIITVKKNRKEDSMEKILAHEGEHVFQDIIGDKNYDIDNFEDWLEGGKAKEEEVIEQFLEKMKKIEESSLKKELLSFFKTGEPVGRIFVAISFSYDFFNKEKVNRFVTMMTGKDYYQVIEEKREEYELDETKAISSLMMIEKSNIDREEAVAMLRHYPVDRWHMVAKRLIEGEKIKQKIKNN